MQLKFIVIRVFLIVILIKLDIIIESLENYPIVSEYI